MENTEIQPWMIGNLVCEKKFQEAIDLGVQLLKTKPYDCGVHINLMDAYFKGRALAPEYFDKSTYHARMAVIYGHCTGYAHLRLAKNLEKGKQYHKALQLYSLILDNPKFHFSRSGVGNSVDFVARRDAVLAKLPKALDNKIDILFSKKEIAIIIKHVRRNDVKCFYEAHFSKFRFRLIRWRENAIYKFHVKKYQLIKRAYTVVELLIQLISKK